MIERTVGPHKIVKVADDVIIQYFARPPLAEEMEITMEAQRELMGDKPYYLCIDLTNVTTISPETRRVIGEGSKKLKMLAIGMYGASFHMKVLAKLINGAISLFKGQDMPQQFFNTREEVLAWVDELRRRDVAKAG